MQRIKRHKIRQAGNPLDGFVQFEMTDDEFKEFENITIEACKQLERGIEVANQVSTNIKAKNFWDKLAESHGFDVSTVVPGGMINLKIFYAKEKEAEVVPIGQVNSRPN